MILQVLAVEKRLTASDLSGLFVAIATILAALYVGRSVGGN